MQPQSSPLRSEHFHRPIDSEGVESQRNQCWALLWWAMRLLSGEPKANLVILGDLNEGQAVGSDGQTLSALFQARPPMVDALSTLSGKISTHRTAGAEERRVYTDHFPVLASIKPQ